MDTAVSTLEQRKYGLLNTIQNEVNSYIVNKGAHCIDLVEKDSEKDDVVHRHWRTSIDPDYCEVLFKFVRKKTIRGHVIDSALTEPVCDIVIKNYEEFYSENADVVSQGILKEMTNNDLILKSFLTRLTDKALSKASSQIRKQIVHEIVQQIHDSTQQGALHAVGHSINNVSTHVIGSSVAATVVSILVKLLAHHIAIIVAKLMATAFVKNLLHALMKKIIIKIVGVTVLKFLATHVAAAAGGASIMWIVLPLLVAYIGYKISTFPEKIGKEVSAGVRQELSDRFEGMNRSILDDIMKEVMNGEKLIVALATDKTMVSSMEQMAESMKYRG